jgi:hypothetical protein
MIIPLFYQAARRLLRAKKPDLLLFKIRQLLSTTANVAVL